MKVSISGWYTLTRKKVVHFNPQNDISPPTTSRGSLPPTLRQIDPNPIVIRQAFALTIFSGFPCAKMNHSFCERLAQADMIDIGPRLQFFCGSKIFLGDTVKPNRIQLMPNASQLCRLTASRAL